MINVSVIYPDGTESTFQTGNVDVFVATILSGKDSVIEKGLRVVADGVEVVFEAPVVTAPEVAPAVIEEVLDAAPIFEAPVKARKAKAK